MAEKKIKSPRNLERYFKGMSNHRRIQILLLVMRQPGIILDDIVSSLQANEKTVGEHVRRLVIAGLIEKRYAGRMVEHRLTPYGDIFADFVRRFGNLPRDDS